MFTTAQKQYILDRSYAHSIHRWTGQTSFDIRRERLAHARWSKGFKRVWRIVDYPEAINLLDRIDAAYEI